MSRLTLNKKGQIVQKQLKYRNKITEVDGIKFHSKMEANRYQELLLLAKSKKITYPSRQKIWYLTGEALGDKHNLLIGQYVSDFEYYDLSDENYKFRSNQPGAYVIEDVKGVETPLFKIKWNLMHCKFYKRIQDGRVILRLVKKDGAIEDNKFFNIKGKEKT